MKIIHYVEAADLSFRVPWIDLMKELEKRGARQTLLCRAGGNLERAARERGVEVVTWKPTVTNFPPINLKYPAILRKVAPDIVHTRLSSAANIAGFWGRFLGVPTIAMLDGIYKRKYYRRADRLTSSSLYAKRGMEEKGFDPEKIDVVYNSVEVAKYRRDEAARARFREERGIGRDEKLFVAIGSFARVKGFDLLIEAFAAIRERQPRARLLLAGDGPERESYRKLLDKFRVGEERVILSPGYLTDVRPWMWAADFFVLPSRWESFSIVLLEAMAAGLPCISTDVGGESEIVRDGENGLLIPSEDVAALSRAMERMLDLSDDERRRIVANANERLQNFTSEALASRQMEAYERTLAQARRSA